MTAEGEAWLVTGPGWWPDMPEGAYYGDPVPWSSLSASMCKVLIQPGGPAKLRQQLNSPPAPKAEFDIGHAAHKLVLGVGAELALIPHAEWRTKEAKAAVAEARAEGKIPMRPADWDRVHTMAERVYAHPEAAALLNGVVPEVSAFRRHESGMWLRSRFDAVGNDRIIDYKSTRSAAPEAFRRDAANLGYHVQAAFYSAMSHALDGLPDNPDFVFIAQEKEPPYLVSVIELSPAFLAIGTAAYEHAIALYQRCQETGEWPGYPNQTTVLDPPPWLSSAPDSAAEPGGPEQLDPALEAAFAELLGELA